jgi:hypothetical protein
MIFKFSSKKSVGLLGRVINPVTRPLPTQNNTNIEEECTDIHASSGIWIYDPIVWADEDILYLRPRGHRDRLILFNNKISVA